MTTAHTPMTSNGSIVFLPNAVCFSVAGCPDAAALAALIARSCTAHQQLVDALKACLIAMRSDLPPAATKNEIYQACGAIFDATGEIV